MSRTQEILIALPSVDLGVGHASWVMGEFEKPMTHDPSPMTHTNLKEKHTLCDLIVY